MQYHVPHVWTSAVCRVQTHVRTWIRTTTLHRKSVIEAVEHGEKKENVAIKFGIVLSTVLMILSQRGSVMGSKLFTKKWNQKSENTQLNECLVQWLGTYCQKNLPINGPMLNTKAKTLAIQNSRTRIVTSQNPVPVEWTHSFYILISRNERRNTKIPTIT